MKKMVRKLAVYLIMLLLVLPGIIAIKTDITIKTKPDTLVSINVADPYSEEKIFNAFERADSSGMYITSFSTGLEKVNIEIVSKDNQNVIIGSQEYENYVSGNAIALNFIEEEQNESAVAETLEGNITAVNESSPNNVELLESVNEIEDNEAGITGLAVGKILNKKVIYVVVGAILLAVVVFFGIRMKKKLSGKKDIVVKKLSEMQEEKQEKIEDYKETIEKAEKKIREAQNEINSLRNQSRIREMERKLQQDQAELRRLRGG